MTNLILCRNFKKNLLHGLLYHVVIFDRCFTPTQKIMLLAHLFNLALFHFTVRQVTLNGENMRQCRYSQQTILIIIIQHLNVVSLHSLNQRFYIQEGAKAHFF